MLLKRIHTSHIYVAQIFKRCIVRISIKVFFQRLFRTDIQILTLVQQLVYVRYRVPVPYFTIPNIRIVQIPRPVFQHCKIINISQKHTLIHSAAQRVFIHNSAGFYIQHSSRYTYPARRDVQYIVISAAEVVNPHFSRTYNRNIRIFIRHILFIKYLVQHTSHINFIPLVFYILIPFITVIALRALKSV